MHIYAFGSICRGDVDLDSDIDVLVLTNTFEQRFDPLIFSIYSYPRMQELWTRGNPFAWHLHMESKLLFASDDTDFITGLGVPHKYQSAASDCTTFFEQFLRAKQSLQCGCNSTVFELSCVFLSIRNFATCFALGYLDIHEFSRHSARRIGNRSLNISDRTFSILQRSRLISTRGRGDMLSLTEVGLVLSEIDVIDNWMSGLMEEMRDERVQ